MAEETSVSYSEKYYDDMYEYRHVRLPAHIAEVVPRNHLMTESEWRNLGIQQSPFWEHYMLHTPEPHILLYRRLKEIALNEQAQAQNTSNE